MPGRFFIIYKIQISAEDNYSLEFTNTLNEDWSLPISTLCSGQSQLEHYRFVYIPDVPIIYEINSDQYSCSGTPLIIDPNMQRVS